VLIVGTIFIWLKRKRWIWPGGSSAPGSWRKAAAC